MARSTRRGRTTSGTLAGALQAELRRSAIVLRGGEPARDDVLAAHDRRVALRRLRSALRVYRPVLDAGWAAETSAELGWLANELGPLRAAEVRSDRVRFALEQAGGGLGSGAGRAGGLLARRAEEDRAAALRSLAVALSSERARHLERRLEQLIEDPPISPRAGTASAEVVVRLLERPWLDLRGAARAVRGKRAPGSLADLHALRLRATHLRYAAELSAPLVTSGLDRLAQSCGALQDRLGEHRDSIETAEWLLPSAEVPELAFVAGLLFADEHRRAAAAIDGLEADWREIRRRWRRWRAATLR